MVDIAADTTTTADFETLGVVNGLSLVSAGSYSGRLETADDKDWIRFTVSSAGTWTFFAQSQDIGSGYGDSVLKLFDANGVELASSDDRNFLPTDDRNSQFTFSFLSAGTYYLQIERYNLGGVGQPGTYTVSAMSGTVSMDASGATLGDDTITATSASTYFGDGGDDVINLDVLGSDAWGEQGDDQLVGNGQINLLFGGLGNDRLIGDSEDDILHGDAGDDFLDGGNDDDKLNGGDGFDVLSGGAGNDDLIGGTGDDILMGGTDDDIYAVDSQGDVIIEVAGEGSADSVIAEVSFVLAADDDIESLSASPSVAVAINLTGNALAQTIQGNDGANILSGLGDNDTLLGLGGSDRLLGGTGKDTYTGGAGNDRFVFKTSADSLVGTNRDTITDFSVAGTLERIDLSAFSGSFTFRGTNAFSSAGKEVGYKFSGADTLVRIDLDGDKAAEMEIMLTGHKVLTATDFFL